MSHSRKPWFNRKRGFWEQWTGFQTLPGFNKNIITDEDIWLHQKSRPYSDDKFTESILGHEATPGIAQYNGETAAY